MTAIQLWPFWLGGIALATVALGHWLLLGRQMAVSGRFSAIVNRLRHREDEPLACGEGPANAEEMIEALRNMTADEFGADSVSEAPAEADRDLAPAVLEQLARKKPSMALHWLFLGGLSLGGFASASLIGLEGTPLPTGTAFEATFGDTPWSGRWVLILAGLLVGFGTRMAAGCTSGHGLCGVSRFQKGSLLSTAAFFGAGVVTSLLLGATR